MLKSVVECVRSTSGFAKRAAGEREEALLDNHRIKEALRVQIEEWLQGIARDGLGQAPMDPALRVVLAQHLPVRLHGPFRAQNAVQLDELERSLRTYVGPIAVEFAARRLVGIVSQPRIAPFMI